MKYKILYLLFGLFVWFGCNDEDALKPSGTEEPFLTLPQGDNDYDHRIMALFEEYGVSIFYKFEPKDVYFTYTSGNWSELQIDTASRTSTYYFEDDPNGYTVQLDETQDSVFIFDESKAEDERDTTRYKIGVTDIGGGLEQTVVVNTNSESKPTWVVVITEYLSYRENTFTVECADENYVNKQLDLLETAFMSYYSSEMLKLGLPPRIMLGRELTGVSGNTTTSQAFATGSNCFIINYGDASIDVLTQENKRELKNSLNEWFLAEGLLDTLYTQFMENTDFFEKTDYSIFSSGKPGSSTCAKNGIVSFYVNPVNWSVSTPVETLQKGDLQSYLALAINYTYEELIEEVDPVKTGGFLARWDVTIGTGRLSSKQDTEGVCEEKYNIVIDYMKTLGVDLEEMSRAYMDSSISGN